MPRNSPSIKLTRRERAELVRRSTKYRSEYRDVIRAKIVLLASKGLANDIIGVRRIDVGARRNACDPFSANEVTMHVSLAGHEKSIGSTATRLSLPCTRTAPRKNCRPGCPVVRPFVHLRLQVPHKCNGEAIGFGSIPISPQTEIGRELSASESELCRKTYRFSQVFDCAKSRRRHCSRVMHKPG